MIRFLALAALVVAAAPSAAHAQWTLGVRGGFGIAYGEADATLGMRRWLNKQAPVQLDLGRRLNDTLSVGGYASYAAAFVSDSAGLACDYADCGGHVVRVGVAGEVRLHAGAPTSAWIGGATGLEFATLSVDGGGSQDVMGSELTLAAGLDFGANGRATFGPFASFSLGRYTILNGSALEDPSFHGWFTLGLRGTFDLAPRPAAAGGFAPQR